MAGNSPAPNAVNDNGAALAFASESVNVKRGRGTLLSSSQAMAATTNNFVYEGASIAQEYVERNAAGKVLKLHHVGGMKSTGSKVQGCLSHGTTTTDLTWLLVCVRCEVAACSICTSRV